MNWNKIFNESTPTPPSPLTGSKRSEPDSARDESGFSPPFKSAPPSKTTAVDMDNLREKIGLINSEIKNKEKFNKDGSLGEMVLSLVTLLTSVVSAVDQHENEIRNLQLENDQLKSEIMCIKNDSMGKVKEMEDRVSTLTKFENQVQEKESTRRFCNELELADKSIKIINFPIRLATNEKDEIDIGKFKESLTNDNDIIRNSLREARVIPLLKKGSDLKKIRNSDNPTLPILIQCRDKDSKSLMLNEISNDSDLSTRYHYSKNIFNKVKDIRESLTKNKFLSDGVEYDLTKNPAQLLIRPNRNYTALNICYRKKIGNDWSNIGSVSWKIDSSGKFYGIKPKKITFSDGIINENQRQKS